MPERRLRVLTLTDSLVGYGGAERLAIAIARNLDPSRFESAICATRPRVRESVIGELEEAGIRTIVLERRRRLGVASWAPLLSFIRRTKPDVIHAHKFGSNVWGVIWGRLTGVPVVISHEHTWSYEGQPLRRFLDRELIARGSSTFVAVSREDQRRMHAVEGIAVDRTTFVPNGVPRLAEPMHDVRRELGIAHSAPIVGTLANLRPQKALHTLVEAAAQLRTSFPDLQVLIGGDGPERPRLEALIAEHRLEQTVRLLGMRDDKADVLAAFDIAVSTSTFEGSPLALMEYMAAGLPVVATRVGGVPDLIDDGAHGFLVPPDEPAAVADSLAKLLRDPDLRARQGAAARERQRAEFDLGVMVHRIETLYEELFARTRRAREERWTPSRKNAASRSS